MDTQVHTHTYLDTQIHKYADIHIYTLHTDIHIDTAMHGHTDACIYINTYTDTQHIHIKT